MSDHQNSSPTVSAKHQSFRNQTNAVRMFRFITSDPFNKLKNKRLNNRGKIENFHNTPHVRRGTHIMKKKLYYKNDCKTRTCL